jgi:uncharacterized protein
MSTPDPLAPADAAVAHDPYLAPPPAPEAPAAALVPTADARIDALDVVRGFALLGIFLMNVEFFSRPMQDIGGPGIDPAMHGLDYAADALIFFFVQNKFWILFSLLFGMGFAVMIERAREAGRPFLPAYLRRTFALLGIGAVHGLLIWAGDILMTYAVTALLMIALRQVLHLARDNVGDGTLPLRARTLAVLGAICFALPLAMAMGGAAQGTGPRTPEQAREHAEYKAETAQLRADAEAAYAHGSYADAVQQRTTDMAEQFEPQSLIFFLPGALGVFVLGMAILRSGVMQRPADFQPQLRRVRALGLGVGLPLMAFSVWLGTSFDFDRFGPRQALQVDTYMLAGLVLAIAYGACLLLALCGRAGGWLRRWLAPAGRMALTNYLTQSLVGTWTFYGYGLGLWGQVGRAGQVAFVAAVFAVQLLLSRWWLARFRFGPAEWVWRALTYWQLPPMRRAAPA